MEGNEAEGCCPFPLDLGKFESLSTRLGAATYPPKTPPSQKASLSHSLFLPHSLPHPFGTREVKEGQETQILSLAFFLNLLYYLK